MEEIRKRLSKGEIRRNEHLTMVESAPERMTPSDSSQDDLNQTAQNMKKATLNGQPAVEVVFSRQKRTTGAPSTDANPAALVPNIFLQHRSGMEATRKQYQKTDMAVDQAVRSTGARSSENSSGLVSAAAAAPGLAKRPVPKTDIAVEQEFHSISAKSSENRRGLLSTAAAPPVSGKLIPAPPALPSDVIPPIPPPAGAAAKDPSRSSQDETFYESLLRAQRELEGSSSSSLQFGESPSMRRNVKGILLDDANNNDASMEDDRKPAARRTVLSGDNKTATARKDPPRPPAIHNGGAEKSIPDEPLPERPGGALLHSSSSSLPQDHTFPLRTNTTDKLYNSHPELGVSSDPPLVLYPPLPEMEDLRAPPTLDGGLAVTRGVGSDEDGLAAYGAGGKASPDRKQGVSSNRRSPSISPPAALPKTRLRPSLSQDERLAWEVARQLESEDLKHLEETLTRDQQLALELSQHELDEELALELSKQARDEELALELSKKDQADSEALALKLSEPVRNDDQLDLLERIRREQDALRTAGAVPKQIEPPPGPSPTEAVGADILLSQQIAMEEIQKSQKRQLPVSLEQRSHPAPHVEIDGRGSAQIPKVRHGLDSSQAHRTQMTRIDPPYPSAESSDGAYLAGARPGRPLQESNTGRASGPRDAPRASIPYEVPPLGLPSRRQQQDGQAPVIQRDDGDLPRFRSFREYQDHLEGAPAEYPRSSGRFGEGGPHGDRLVGAGLPPAREGLSPSRRTAAAMNHRRQGLPVRPPPDTRRESWTPQSDGHLLAPRQDPLMAGRRSGEPMSERTLGFRQRKEPARTRERDRRQRERNGAIPSQVAIPIPGSGGRQTNDTAVSVASDLTSMDGIGRNRNQYRRQRNQDDLNMANEFDHLELLRRPQHEEEQRDTRPGEPREAAVHVPEAYYTPHNTLDTRPPRHPPDAVLRTPSDEQRALMQVGQRETANAIEMGQAHVVQCRNCRGRLKAPIAYALVFCPNCHTTSPNESLHEQPTGRPGRGRR